MNGRLKNGLLIAAVVSLAIAPLIMNRHVEKSSGTDDQASAAIQAIAPGYKPWFNSIFYSPDPGTEKLLFALQAAIGIGFIGYYVHRSRKRTRS